MDEGLTPDIRQRLQIVDQSLHCAGQKLRSLLLIAQASAPVQSIPLRQLVEDLITLTNFMAVINKVTVTSEFYYEADWQGSLTELALGLLSDVLNNAIEAAAGQSNGQVLIRVERREDFNCLKYRIMAWASRRKTKPAFLNPSSPPKNLRIAGLDCISPTKSSAPPAAMSNSSLPCPPPRVARSLSEHACCYRALRASLLLARRCLRPWVASVHFVDGWSQGCSLPQRLANRILENRKTREPERAKT